MMRSRRFVAALFVSLVPTAFAAESTVNVTFDRGKQS